MSGVVRTGINTARLAVQAGAQVARRRLLLNHGNLLSRMRGVIAEFLERVHVDVAVRTIVCTLAATDTPIFDDDFPRVAAANGANRAADHAIRIQTRTTGARHQVLVETESLADQP